MTGNRVTPVRTAGGIRRPMYVFAKDPSFCIEDFTPAIRDRGPVIACLSSHVLWPPLLSLIRRECPSLADSIDALPIDQLDDATRALAEWELEYSRRSAGGLLSRIASVSRPSAHLIEMSSEVCCWIEQLRRIMPDHELESRELAEARAQAFRCLAEAWQLVRPLFQLHADRPCLDHSHPLLDILEEVLLRVERAIELLPEATEEVGGLRSMRSCIALLAHSGLEDPSVSEIVIDGFIGRSDRLVTRLSRMHPWRGGQLPSEETEFFTDAVRRVDEFGYKFSLIGGATEQLASRESDGSSSATRLGSDDAHVPDFCGRDGVAQASRESTAICLGAGLSLEPATRTVVLGNRRYSFSRSRRQRFELLVVLAQRGRKLTNKAFLKNDHSALSWKGKSISDFGWRSAVMRVKTELLGELKEVSEAIVITENRKSYDFTFEWPPESGTDLSSNP